MCYKYGLRCLPPPNTHTHPVLQKEKKKKLAKKDGQLIMNIFPEDP